MFTDNLTIIKSKLKDVPGQINFAQDLWTALNNDAYISITAHWIDIHWNLKDIVLDIKEVRGSHSGENLAEIFCEILEEYNIIPKVVRHSILAFLLYFQKQCFNSIDSLASTRHSRQCFKQWNIHAIYRNNSGGQRQPAV
jgi:hypothetical protein